MGQGRDLRPRKRRTKREIAVETERSVANKRAAKENFFRSMKRGIKEDASKFEETRIDRDRPSPRDAGGCGGVDTLQQPVHAIEDGPRAQSGLGVVDDTKWVILLSGHQPQNLAAEETVLGELLQGWTIMHRTIDDDGFLWRMGKVKGPGQSSSNRCLVQFSEGEEELLLELDMFCDGSEVQAARYSDEHGGGCPWFRVIRRDEHERHQREHWMKQEARMRDRCGRKYCKEDADGHCGFRAIIRQYLLQRDVEVGKITASQIRMARDLLADALESQYKHVARVTRCGSTRRQDEVVSNLKRRAKRMREVNCNVVCSSDDYFGGECSSDPIALAKHLSVTIYIVQKMATAVQKFGSDGTTSDVQLSNMSPSDKDIVLLYHPTEPGHFDSLIPEIAPAAEEAEEEDISDDESSHTFDAVADDNRLIEDDPIQGVDDAPPAPRAYFEQVVAEIRDAVGRTGNRFGSKITGKWPWKTLWHTPEDPKTLPIITPDDYKRMQWGRLLVWLPEILYRRDFPSGKLPCKWHGANCACVVSHDFLNTAGPRLVIDCDGAFYIWCGTYECSIRRNSGQHPYQFNGYDAATLRHLSRPILAEFPALLTRRSAISIKVMKQMVALATNGVSFSNFRAMLKELHLSKLADLQAQYAEDLKSRLQQPAALLENPQRRLKFDFSSFLYRRHGSKSDRFPSTQWLIERWHEYADTTAELFDRRMMMIDGPYLSGDKSHKATKLVYTRLSADDNRQTRVFDGCMTLYNTRHQVVGQWLLRTSSQEEVRAGLEGVAERYRQHGFVGPLLYSTDDCCHEERMLTDVFASLRGGRISVALECNLVPLALPCFDRSMSYVDTKTRCSTAASELQVRVNDGTLRYVGLDAEWVPGKPTSYGVDTLQLATADGCAYLFTRRVLEDCPTALRNLLNDPDLAKVGRHIGPDVKRLVEGHGLLVANSIDIGKRAKELKLINRANPKLDELVRRFLKRQLHGKWSIRLSSWDASELSDEQIAYALVDAFAGALVYEFLESCSDSDLIPARTDLSHGVEVRIFNKGNSRLAAIGTVESSSLGEVTATDLDEDDVVVRISHLIAPATKLIRGTGTLGEVGVGGLITWKRKRIRPLPPTWSTRMHKDIIGSSWTDPDCNTTYRAIGFSYGEEGLRVEYVAEGDDDEINVSRVDEVLAWLEGVFDEELPPASDISLDAHVVGVDAQVELPESSVNVDYGDGNDVEEIEDHDGVSELLPPDDTMLGSTADKEHWRRVRVKLDALHAMMRFQRTLRTKHGAHDHFMSRLRDAFFTISADDVENLKQVLVTRYYRRRKSRQPVISNAELWKLAREHVQRRYHENYAYFAHRCRRTIAAPDVLERSVRQVVDLFANCRDAATGQQLFTPKTWRVYKSIVAHIRRGCLSDHPDLNYYHLSHVTKDGRRVYNTIRGTSQLEGYHHHLRALFARASHSPRLLISLLRAFNYRWNVDMAVDNGDLSEMYRGWYDHWLVEDIQETTAALHETPEHPEWVSTKDYAPTKEKFYLGNSLKSSQTQRTDVDDDDDVVDSEDAVLWQSTLTPSLRWLAEYSGCKIPVTRVSTHEERLLFVKEYRRFLTSSTSANAHSAFDATGFAEWWEQEVCHLEAERKYNTGIFRKTAGLLKEHYRNHLRHLNSAATIAGRSPSGTTQTVRGANNALRSELRDPARRENDFLEPAPPLPFHRQSPTSNAPAPAASPEEVNTHAPTRADTTGCIVAGETDGVQKNLSFPVQVRDVRLLRANIEESTCGLLSRRDIPQPRRPDQESANTRADPRCRRCGRLKVSDPVSRGRHGKRVRKDTAAFCRVNPSLFLPGYPKPGYAHVPTPSDGAESTVADDAVVALNAPSRVQVRDMPPLRTSTEEGAGDDPRWDGIAPPLWSHRQLAGTRADPRCRRCGRLKVSDPVARDKHGNGVRKDTDAFCRVSPSQFLPGFPKRGYASREGA